MARLVDERTAETLTQSLSAPARPVRLVLFTQATIACATCREQRQFLEELVALSDKLSLEVKDLVAGATAALAADRYLLDRAVTTEAPLALAKLAS